MECRISQNSTRNNRHRYEALWFNLTNPYIIPSKPRSDVYCFKFNFNISNVGFCVIKTEMHKV